MGYPTFTQGMRTWFKASGCIAEHGREICNAVNGLNILFDQSDGGSADFSQGTSGLAPLMNHNAKNRRPSLLFDGADDLMTGGAVNSYVAASAKIVVIAFRAVSITSNNATSYNNDGLFCASAGGFGFCLRSTPYLYVYNVDAGGADTISFDASEGMSVGDWHVVYMAHNGATLYACLDSIDNVKTTASGVTSNVAGTMQIGKAAGAYYGNVEVGEIMTFNSYTGGGLPTAGANSDSHAIFSYFESEWLDRGDPLALAQDVSTRRMATGRGPRSEIEAML